MSRTKSYSCVKPLQDKDKLLQDLIRCNRIIKKHMGALNVDIPWLAEAIGMKRTTIYARFQEGGNRDPTRSNWELPELVAICKALRIPKEDALVILGLAA